MKVRIQGRPVPFWLLVRALSQNLSRVSLRVEFRSAIIARRGGGSQAGVALRPPLPGAQHQRVVAAADLLAWSGGGDSARASWSSRRKVRLVRRATQLLDWAGNPNI